MLVKLIVSTLMFLSIVSSLDASELKVYDSDMSFDSFEMEVFEDQSTQLTIDEIIQVNRFSKTKNSISRGYSQSNFWFRFDIRNQTNDTLTYIIESTEPSAHYVDFYLIKNKTIESNYHAGVGRVTKDGVIENQNPKYEIELAPFEEISIYIKYFSLFPIYTSIQVHTPKSYYAATLLRDKFLYLYFGIALSLVIYNFFLFIYSRETIYLLYISYASLFALWQVSLYGYPPFATNSSTQEYYLTASIIPLWVASLIFFTRKILNLQTFFPSVDKVIKLIAYLYLALTLLSWFNLHFAFNIINTLSTIILPLLLIMAIKSYRTGNRVALFYIIAQIPFLFATTIYSLMTDGYLEYNLFTRYSIVVGSAFELFLFSLALGYKLKVLQIEKIEAIENLNRELESKIIEHTQALKDSNQKLRRLSVTDQLTNLYNRRGIDTLLEKSYIEFTKENMRFGIILLDIDYFKRINDKYGHDIGDYVLRQIAQTLAKGIEEHHYLGRWGGEEFLIIASHDDLSSLSNLAQKLRANIEALALKGIESVTASFGVAMIDSTKNTAQVVKEADNNLYQAKKEGRNRVVPEI